MRLKDYQAEAVNSLKNGNILYGSVGSGKSFTSLAYYVIKVCGGQVGREDNEEPTIVPENRPRLYIITTAKKRDSGEWKKDLAGVQIEQETVKIDSWNNIKNYIDVKDSFFIFDEQRVVGYGSWTKSFLKITKHNKWILLTATPGDTWMDYLPVFIANGFYASKKDFTSRHVVFSPYTKFPKIDKYLNESILRHYRQDILVKMEDQRRTSRHRFDLYSDFNQEQYNIIFRKRWDPWEEQPIIETAKLCYLLRKCVNSDPTRVELLRKLLMFHKRAIVFYNHNYELEIIKKALDEMKYEYKEWNGNKHEDLPSGDDWVYLVQYTAGAEGWNCTETDTIIFYSLTYSYKNTEQAMGRIDRANTPYLDLYYYFIMSRSPIDMAIRSALHSKKNFNERDFMYSRK